MRRDFAARAGLISISVSSFLLVVTVIITIGGGMYESQIRYEENDLLVSNGSGTLTVDVSLVSVLHITIDSEKDLRIRLMIVDSESGETILDEIGYLPIQQQVVLDDPGEYSISIEVLSGGSPGDIELEVGLSGNVILITCCFGVSLSIGSVCLFILGSLLMYKAVIRRHKKVVDEN
jgi:hypothetical protein